MDRAIVNVAKYELHKKTNTTQSDKLSCCKMMTKMMINLPQNRIGIFQDIDQDQDQNVDQATAEIGSAGMKSV